MEAAEQAKPPCSQVCTSTSSVPAAGLERSRVVVVGSTRDLLVQQRSLLLPFFKRFSPRLVTTHLIPAYHCRGRAAARQTCVWALEPLYSFLLPPLVCGEPKLPTQTHRPKCPTAPFSATSDALFRLFTCGLLPHLCTFLKRKTEAGEHTGRPCRPLSPPLPATSYNNSPSSGRRDW